ncbi:MAG: hypothetical protein L3J41_12515 [Melioribacteraceae bacterium]|nr:hypothetical protein [Melioribacteraceae bacterium]
MRFKKLEITDWKQFQNIEIEFHDKYSTTKYKNNSRDSSKFPDASG